MSKDFLASLVLIGKLSNPCFVVIGRFGKDTAASSRSGKEKKATDRIARTVAANEFRICLIP